MVVTEIVGLPEGVDILPALSNFSIYPPAKNGHKLVKICLKIVFYSSLYLLIFLSFDILQFLLLGITIAYNLINFIFSIHLRLQKSK